MKNNFECKFLKFDEFYSNSKVYYKLSILINNRTSEIFINDNKSETLISSLRTCNYLDDIILDYDLYINKSGILSIVITDLL